MTHQVIDRLRYDDATATQIAAFNNGQPQGSKARQSEAMFKTPNGRYFLRVRRPRRTHTQQPGARRFVALGRMEAIDWLESNGFATELGAEFPLVDA